MDHSACKDLMAEFGGKYIDHDVVFDEPTCINHDLWVRGSVTFKAPVCMTGNMIVTGKQLLMALIRLSIRPHAKTH